MACRCALEKVKEYDESLKEFSLGLFVEVVPDRYANIKDHIKIVLPGTVRTKKEIVKDASIIVKADYCPFCGVKY